MPEGWSRAKRNQHGALLDAIRLMDTYFLPMCGRVLGDAAATTEERNARILANWLAQTKPKSVNVTEIRDTAKLPGLRSSDTVKAACRFLEEAGLAHSSHNRTTRTSKGRLSSQPTAVATSIVKHRVGKAEWRGADGPG